MITISKGDKILFWFIMFVLAMQFVPILVDVSNIIWFVFWGIVFLGMVIFVYIPEKRHEKNMKNKEG